MDCPRCGFLQPDGAAECARCGVVFGRLPREGERRTIRRTGVRQAAAPSTPLLDDGARKSLGIGFAVALVVFLVPFLNYVFNYLVILVHELGHAVVAWLFGYPAIPAFDFMYGGGVTFHEDRKILLMLVIYAGFGAVFWTWRRNRLSVSVLAGVVAVYTLLAFTPLHELLQIFMGHGFELIFAGIFLYRAVSGEKIRVPAERPLYAFVGFFILFSDVRFAYRLIYSAEHRAMYENAKGGGHWMDFSRIAEDYLRTDLSTVAGFFMLACVLPVVATLLVWANRERIREFAGRLLARDLG